tara:strand:+ start:298 stop:750 length:453 start_codon:yes stop_codon:yes gene_type:complete
MVAEVLAGIALVKASCEIISKGIGAAKDVSSVAKEVDNLFEGTRQLKREEKQARHKGQSVTEIVINQQLADEQVAICKDLIIGRFGYYAWQSILQMQRDQRLEEKARAAAKKRQQQEKAELVEDVAVVGTSVMIGILIIAVVAAVVLAMI